MSERSEPQYMQSPDGTGNEGGLDDRAATGSDDSAGIATRIFAAVLLALVFPWEITRRVVTRGVPRMARMLGNGGARTSKAVGGGARRVAASLAFIGSRFSSAARPLADLGARCWHGLGHGFSLIGDRAGRAGRWVRAVIKAAAGPVTVLFSWVGSAIAAAAQVTHGVGSALVWLLRPVSSAGAAVLRRVGVVAGVVARAVARVVGGAAAGLWAGACWCGRAIGAVLKGGLAGAGDALRPCLAAASWAVHVALRLLSASFKLIWLGLAGAGRLAWVATHWAWKQLVAPCLSGIGSVVRTGWRGLGAPLTGAIGRAVSSVATALGHSAVVATGTLLARAIRQTARRVSAPIQTVAAAARARRRVVAQGTLVAFATARHQASRAGLPTSAREADWRAAIPQSAASSEPDDHSIASTFTTECFQNAFVAPGESRVSAIVSVSAEDFGSARSEAEAVELILVDCSASMGHPWDKIQAARNATRAAVETLRDGVWFAIVRGAESAEVVYPRREGLVQASPETKRAAVRAAGSLQPVGGTAIGSWLTLAAELTSLRPRAMHHAILLTDGKDEDETESELDAAIARCEGLFQCDCRGVGTDWAVSELRKISTALLGSLDIIRDPAAMESDFRLMTETAMARQLEVSLRIWVPNHARINFLRQVSPSILDLTPRGRTAGPLMTDYLTGAWGTERREYHVSVNVRPGQVGAEMLASRVSVLVGNQVVAKAMVKAIWTEDETLTAPLSPEVAHYTGQAELAKAIQEGLEARRNRDEERAAIELGRAAQLAAESGNDAIAELIANVVDVVDADTGTVRIRKTVDLSDEMALDTRSTKTVRISSFSRSREPGTTSGA